MPPAIAARILGAPLNVALSAGQANTTQVTGLTMDFETVTGMAGTNVLVIPRTGRYTIHMAYSVNVDEPNVADGYAFGLSILINAAQFGRFTAPIISGRAETAHGTAPGQALAAGDQISLVAFTDYPAGLTVTSAWVYAEYIEGT